MIILTIMTAINLAAVIAAVAVADVWTGFLILYLAAFVDFIFFMLFVRPNMEYITGPLPAEEPGGIADNILRLDGVSLKRLRTMSGFLEAVVKTAEKMMEADPDLPEDEALRRSLETAAALIVLKESDNTGELSDGKEEEK